MKSQRPKSKKDFGPEAILWHIDTSVTWSIVGVVMLCALMTLVGLWRGAVGIRVMFIDSIAVICLLILIV